MSSELEDQLLSSIEALQSLIEGTIEADPSIDPLNTTVTDFGKYKQLDPLIETLASQLKTSELTAELTFSRYISEIINLSSSDNNYNLKEIGILLDYAFYFKDKGIVGSELPIVLISWCIRDSNTEWLVKFWPYFEIRYEEINGNPALNPPNLNKGIAILLLIALNFKLQLLSNSFEKSREILRAKILNFANTIYPLFSRYLSNKKFESNTERIDDIKYESLKSNEKLTRTFWRAQLFFQDPFAVFLGNPSPSDISKVKFDLDDLLKEIFRTHEVDASSRRRSNLSNDNSKEKYEQSSLSETKRDESKHFYDSKELNPSFYIDDSKFLDQLKNDTYLRRVLLLQILITVSSFDALSHIILPTISERSQDDPHKKIRLAKIYFTRNKRDLINFLNIKKDILRYIQNNTNDRWFYSIVNICEISEVSNFDNKVKQFKDTDPVVELFKYDEKLESLLSKNAEFKPRFWAKFGTREITNHWKVDTGLEKLQKPDIEGNIEQIDIKIEELKTQIEGHDDQSAKELLNWKGLRLARRNHLFEFEHVVEEAGVAGIFDHDLKNQIEQRKTEERIKQEEENAKKEQEEKNEVEKLLKEEEERKAGLDEENERKRKAELERFDEDSKRAKLESAHSNGDSGADLDY